MIRFLNKDEILNRIQAIMDYDRFIWQLEILFNMDKTPDQIYSAIDYFKIDIVDAILLNEFKPIDDKMADCFLDIVHEISYDDFLYDDIFNEIHFNENCTPEWIYNEIVNIYSEELHSREDL